MENKTIIWATIGTLLGGSLLWYLSREKSLTIDPKIHTDQQFRAILAEIKLEFTCIYVRHYNLILKMKESNTFKTEMLDDLEAQVKQEQNEKTDQVIQTHQGFTFELVQDWLAKNKADPEVINHASELSKLHEDVYKRVKITDLCYAHELPQQMSKEVYIQIYRKIFATLRHDLYVKIKETLKQKHIVRLSEDEFSQMWGEVWKTFEQVREDIYNLMMDTKVDQKVAKKVMQSAYVTYAAISSVRQESNDPAIRSRWADLVTEAANKHAQYLDQMRKGEFYPTLDIDPRDSKDADEKVSLQGMAQGLSSQQTMLDDKKTHVTALPKTADKFINKFVERAKQKQAEKQASVVVVENVEKDVVVSQPPISDQTILEVEENQVEQTQIPAQAVETTEEKEQEIVNSPTDQQIPVQQSDVDQIQNDVKKETLEGQNNENDTQEKTLELN